MLLRSGSLVVNAGRGKLLSYGYPAVRALARLVCRAIFLELGSWRPGWRPADVVDGPGMGLLLGRSLGHGVQTVAQTASASRM
jgi:hypothetical protein